ncbi:MAG: Na-Ca exchanger/integrin-beta4 [Ktedonobacterales bacterium]|jgi:hypothetical protein|nr:MAG: Na-Ca exchanger/integrin-beta4 [Ktedonobacterales bacterium]
MKRRTSLRISLIVASALMALSVLLITPALVFGRPATTSAPKHSHPVVSKSVKNDLSPALRTIPGKPWKGDGHNADDFPTLAPVHRGKPNHIKSYLQTHIGTLAAPTASNNFDGVGNGFSGPNGTFTVASAPPDTNGAVGPQDYVQTVNTDFAVFNKDASRGAVGSVRYGPVAINTLWSGFGGLCQTDNDGDPTVVYDGIANRWIISQFAVTNPDPNFYQCVAVSTTSDPTGSYYRYSFSYSNFPDYPKMAVWPDAYYETYNLFNAAGTSFLGAQDCAFNRSQMLSGAAATQQCFTTSTSYGGLLASNLDGSTLPPTGAPNYVLALGTTTSLAFWKFHVDWTTPANTTFTGPSSIAVTSYAQACGGGTCIPQSGTTNQLDSLADRLMYRLSYRNFGSYESLVVDHAVTAGSSVGMRWYEIRSPGGTPTVYQSGTYAPDSGYRWMGSIAQDQSGDMAMGFSLSSSSVHPGISYTGRLASDPLGQMSQGETSLIVGAGSQTGTLTRWGDYSAMTVDPADDCTFWYTNEYIPSNGSFNWKTRIGSFKFPNCGGTTTNDFSISSSPTSLSIQQGGSGTSTISTAVTSGSAGTVSLTASVSPSGPTATLNPTSVTAGNSSTLTVNVGSSVATGSYTVTVTGTEGSATHNTTVAVTVTAPPTNDFSISSSPTSLSIAQGSSGTSTISTAVTSGSAGTVSLTASVSPSGPTASLSPTSVTAGNSSTLTVSVGSSVATGAYTVTVTGTEGSATHSATVSVTVTSSGGGITNGGFETGAFSGWTTSGAATSISTSSHSGSYAGQAGSTSPTNGDSSISQTFTIPSGSGTLTFWYKVVCPDTVTYDWATVTLKDNTSNTTTTLLAKTCTNTGTWVKVSGSVTAGHSVTLTLTSHDDNYAGDATYTLYDDVALSAPITNPVTNPGFETGAFSGWTTSGAATSISTSSHSGSYAGQAGSTSPTNGDSSISQTFTIPSGASSISFWYKVVCPDTVTYDWATVTLKDNTSNTTTTLLAKTCTNTGTWVKVSGSVTAGHSVTLTLTSHDDNYAGDATYTLYDDVAVS